MSEKLESFIERIDAKLDDVVVQTTAMGKDIERNTKDLAEHMRRTDILERKFLKLTYILLFVAGAALMAGSPVVKAILGAIL